jgi:hypothetical protein
MMWGEGLSGFNILGKVLSNQVCRDWKARVQGPEILPEAISAIWYHQ